MSNDDQRDRPGGGERRSAVQRPSPPDSVIAPWSPGTVAALNAFQRRGGFHPYTCREDRHSLDGDGLRPRPVLVATTDGWSCPDPGCDQDQHWADGAAIEHGRRLLAAGARPFFSWLTDEEADLS